MVNCNFALNEKILSGFYHYFNAIAFPWGTFAVFSQCFLLSLVATLRSSQISSDSLWASTCEGSNPTPSSLWLNSWPCCSNTLFIRYSPTSSFFPICSVVQGHLVCPSQPKKRAFNWSYWHFPVVLGTWKWLHVLLDLEVTGGHPATTTCLMFNFASALIFF